MFWGQGQPQGVRYHHIGGTQNGRLAFLGVPAQHIMLTLKGLHYYHIRDFQLATFSFSLHEKAYGGLGHSLPNMYVFAFAYKESLF